jgi:hypothetical protein
MATKYTRTDTVRVNDADPQVVLQPDNNDLFIRTGRQVIEGCRLGISIELWLEELELMQRAVHNWAAERAKLVRACYCAPRGGRIQLFFIPVSGQFDFDLADALAELNDELVRGFNIGMIEVRQVPGDELDRFLDITSARQVYGEQRQPHPAVET